MGYVKKPPLNFLQRVVEKLSNTLREGDGPKGQKGPPDPVLLSLLSILYWQGTDSIEEDPCGPAVVLVVIQDALLDNRIGGLHPSVEPFD